ncbi:two-component system sensor histidine kinase DctS [Salirhabdus euzebyi]|uniref:histidine kinase n=1 Tax=Salirhabdus euzebyi TaxID=394506 RepID=A0A841Q555_9BACI|nr:sensor histidine kinase [Salirhabdus euzebyi]MBB6453525.1 two-component system sensor histidine kinase DctS [Salirhabdus euzebyi]
MSLKRMPIRWKITILSSGVVLFSILVIMIIYIGNTIESKKEELSDHAMITGRTVANLPGIIQNISLSEGWNTINPIVERIRTVNNANYIVVLNMNRIRFSHPNDKMLGTISSGRDEGPAFAEHSYVTTAKGELGKVVRAFVPIMDEKHEQIGVVIVGNVLPSPTDILLDTKEEIFLILFLTIVFGIIGSWLLAHHIKEQTYQLEPHEIVQLLVERTAIFQAMNEGIIAVDRDNKIIIFNEKAKKILGVEGNIIGIDANTIVKEIELSFVIEKGREVYNEEIRIGDKLIMSSRVPILVDQEVIGAVVVFQDRTEVTQMAEELTGVKAFVDALRVQNHEHMNKLHTIAGLIQLNQNKKALNFVFETTERQEELLKFLGKGMRDYSIAGLLISKISRGRELGIEVSIDEYSQLKQYPMLLDQHDFVLLLGNLIENAFDSFDQVEREEKWIDILIEQNNTYCKVIVEDNGIGLKEDEKKRIFEKGFTTKGEKGSGIGLYLVNKVIEKGMGEVEVISYYGEGTSFIITFPMTHEMREYGDA